MVLVWNHGSWLDLLHVEIDMETVQIDIDIGHTYRNNKYDRRKQKPDNTHGRVGGVFVRTRGSGVDRS